MKNRIRNTYGSWCLVAGAAEGLGEAFSRALAAGGMDLILLDHQKDRLDSLALDVEASFGIQVRTLLLDLASGESIGLMMDVIRETACRMIIYNAAFSKVKRIQAIFLVVQ